MPFWDRKKKQPEAGPSPVLQENKPQATDRLVSAVSHEVEVSLEALREMGLLGDEDADREMLTQHYVELRSTGFQGELYPQVGLSDHGLSFSALLGALDGRRHPLIDAHKAASVWHDVYTQDELSALQVGEQYSERSVHGRMAIANFTSLAVGEPLLHFQGHRFDEYASKRLVIVHPTEPSREIYVDVPTQLEMLSASQENVRQIFHGYNLAALNLPAICAIMLQRRIRGEPLPFQGDNHIHIPQLRRVNVDGVDREIGQIPTLKVTSGQIHLGAFGDSVGMSPLAGIGLSVGRDLSDQ